MAMTACKECGAEISTKASSCPKCGAKVPKFKWWLWVPAGLFGVFMLIGAIRGSSPEVKEQRFAERVIEQCWTDQKLKSLDPGAARFAARVCEKMEDDYLAKYRRRP